MTKLINRFLDIFLSLLALCFMIFPWIIIAIVIKIQSPGPVFYRARRVGKDGKVFVLYKFRSMCVESGEVKTTTLRNDNRVFSFGKILRKSKLDETPQLLNILKGDMTIIGPRPEDEKNAEFVYQGEFKKILSVKPGLSSPASLYDYTHGELFESEEEYEKEFLPKKLLLELYYIENKSLIYDIKIVFRTVFVILMIVFGKKKFKEPKELVHIEKLKKDLAQV